MPQVKPTFEPVAEFTDIAKKIVDKYSDVFASVDVENIKCLAINNKTRSEKKGLWDIKAIPEYALPDCPFAYYVIIYLDDWTEMPDKIKNRLVADVLFAIPEDKGKTKTYDLRAHSPMIRAFGVDFMDSEDGDDPLANEVKWIL